MNYKDKLQRLRKKNTVSLEERQKQEQVLQEKFENLANRVFEHSSKTFVARQKSEMDTLLLPFKKDMDTFKSQVEKYNENFLTSNAALDQKLKHITELNNRMLEDAKNLTEALKGINKNKVHGVKWSLSEFLR